MKLYAYELKLYKEEPNIEIKPFTVRENKTEYFSSSYNLPIDAFQSKGGWYIGKTEIGKNAHIGVGKSFIYAVFLTDNKMNEAKILLKNKLSEIVEADRQSFKIKENLLINLK